MIPEVRAIVSFRALGLPWVLGVRPLRIHVKETGDRSPWVTSTPCDAPSVPCRLLHP